MLSQSSLVEHKGARAFTEAQKLRGCSEIGLHELQVVILTDLAQVDERHLSQSMALTAGEDDIKIPQLVLDIDKETM